MKVDRTYRDNVRLVVFDWAGTTVDFGCQAPILAFIEGFKAKGIEVSARTARGPMGMEKRAHIKAVTEVSDVAEAWHQRYGRAVTEEDIDEMFNDFVPHLLSILDSHSHMISGVIEAVTSLRESGVLIGSTTGYFREAADIVAAAGARAGYVPDYLVCASDVEEGRPYPWMIYRVMEALNICPPEAVVSVGDTEVDMKAGLNGGVWSIGVAATGNEMGLNREAFDQLDSGERESLLTKVRERLYAAGAHLVIDTMEELPAAVKKINVLLGSVDKP
jgi:phosphonoacetaldehyde hydrolase